MAPGLIIAAPGSGSGKTALTLALLRSFRNAGVAVASAKVGPDYIDPAYHAAASGRPCHNLDTWAMRPATLAGRIDALSRGAELVIVEGVMGLFDGGPDGAGSTAELARLTGWPVILVVDARGMAQSAAALVQGYARFSPDVEIAGIVFNRVGSAAHGRLLAEACAPLCIPVIGGLRRQAGLALPDRHLGLVQAAEHSDLEGFLDRAAAAVAEALDLALLRSLTRPARLDCAAAGEEPPLPPLGQRIAVAADAAFSFTYPMVLEGWRRTGAEIMAFSPLQDQPPDPAADALFLPGGYPELHAGRLAGNRRFLAGLRDAAVRGATVYGECGGYMVLGEVLVDGDGAGHEMAGLLPVRTSFAAKRRVLGYREVAVQAAGILGPDGTRYRGHEFHFAAALAEGDAPLFRVWDAAGTSLGAAGTRSGRVAGSFIHVIDGEGTAAPSVEACHQAAVGPDHVRRG
jgi:cobyrinic acid a,c-diamide synthase